MGEFLDQIGSRVGVTIGVLVGAYLLWVLVRRLGRRAKRRYTEGDPEAEDVEREQRAETLWIVIRRVLAMVIFVTTVMTIMAVWGVPIGPLLAAGTAIGVAVGLGAQDFIRDVIAGFFIVIETQYLIGDVVQIAGVSGTVEDIQLRVTVLRDLDGNVHYVPNGQIQVASNYTQVYSQVVIDISVSYDTDVDRALEVLGDELTMLKEEWTDMIIDDPEVLGVNALADSGVVLRAVMMAQPDARWAVKRELLRRLKLRFDQESIVIPYRTVRLVGQVRTST